MCKKIMYFSLIMPALLREKVLNKSEQKIGGAVIQWYSWLLGFKKNGYDVLLLTYKDAKNYIGQDTEFEIIESFDPKRGIPKLRIFYYFIPNLISVLRKNKPDVLFGSVGNIYTGILGIVAKILRIKYVVRIASDADVDSRVSTVLNNSKSMILFSKLGLLLSDHILAQNQFQAEELRKKYPNKRINVIHNPFFKDNIEIDIFKTLSEKENYIAWVGNFRHVKNLPALLNCAKKLPNIVFRIAGVKFENLDQMTENAIRDLEKCENVEFMGYLTRNQLIEFIRKSKGLLNTSILEGFSNTFLEAWYLGTPVISTINVNPDDLIRIHKLGFVADSFEQLPEKICELFDLSDEAYKNMALKCHNYVIDNHDPTKLAEKILQYID